MHCLFSVANINVFLRYRYAVEIRIYLSVWQPYVNICLLSILSYNQIKIVIK